MSSDSSSGRPSTVNPHTPCSGRRFRAPPMGRDRAGTVAPATPPYNPAMVDEQGKSGKVKAAPRGRVFRRSADPSPPVAVRAEGSTIWDGSGRAYLDGAGGALVVNVGHGRRSVARAMAEQAGRIAYAHGTAFTTEPLEAYAAAIGP